jgi:hypothetical protein
VTYASPIWAWVGILFVWGRAQSSLSHMCPRTGTHILLVRSSTMRNIRIICFSCASRRADMKEHFFRFCLRPFRPQPMESETANQSREDYLLDGATHAFIALAETRANK